MQFLHFVVITGALSIGINACKCIDVESGTGPNDALTGACCTGLKGNFVDGNDCEADSISELLSAFQVCCFAAGGYDSDCDCPTC